MKNEPHSPTNHDEYPSDAFAYRDIEHSFLTFYERNARLKNSLSWRITSPIRCVPHYIRRLRSCFIRLRLVIQHSRTIFKFNKNKNILSQFKELFNKIRTPGKIDIAYHKWRQAHPLPLLHSDEISPRNILILISHEALHSPNYPDCLASLQTQRGCTTSIYPITTQLPSSFDAYDAVLWIRMATVLTADYGQIACRSLDSGNILFYADHDTQLSTVLHERPFFKPTFSPELLKQVDYLAAGCALSPTWLTKQSSLHDGMSDISLYEWVRNLSPTQTQHLPLCLSHLLDSAATQLIPPILSAPIATPPTKNQKITIIIPTAFQENYLKTLLKSLHNTMKSYKEDIEIVIITNKDIKQAESSLKDILIPYQLIFYNRDFNYSAFNNEAVQQTNGDILFFLNDDIELKDACWLPDMLALLLRSKTGAVGSLLLYPDNTIQHAGCLIGMNGGVGHIGVGLPADTKKYHGLLTAQREVSAVTGACMAIRREVFLQAQMFDEHLPLSFNDVALCLRLRDMGYTQYITTRSKIIHHESRSRGYDTTARKYQTNREHFLYARAHYPALREIDPYYNLNLDLSSIYEGYAPSSPARQALLLRPASPGCLIILAQRMDYDTSTIPLLTMLTEYKKKKAPVRLIIAGTNETRFSHQCRTIMTSEFVLMKHVQDIRTTLLEAPEDTLLLDLRLREIMEGMSPDRPLTGFWIHNGKPCFIDLFGRRTLLQQNSELTTIK